MKPIFPPLLLLCLLAAGCPKDSYGGNCNLFAHRQVYQHHAIVQQVVAPYAIYQAGADIQADALAEKVSAKVLKLVQQQLTQQQKAAVASPEPITRPASSAFAKCASCHTGANAAGGVVLDGVTAIECRTYAQWGRIAGQAKGIPKQMQALMSSMSDAEKGAINSALLDLIQDQPKAEAKGDLE